MQAQDSTASSSASEGDSEMEMVQLESQAPLEPQQEKTPRHGLITGLACLIVCCVLLVMLVAAIKQ